jgi:hypothetical protein
VRQRSASSGSQGRLHSTHVGTKVTLSELTRRQSKAPLAGVQLAARPLDARYFLSAASSSRSAKLSR